MSGEKTEEPTPARVRRLRERGDVPHSREVERTAALVGASLALVATGPGTVASLTAFAREAWTGALPVDGALARAAALLIDGAGPPAAAAAVSAIGATLAQTGALFAPAKLLPDASRFAPGQTWSQRLRVETWMTGGLAVIGTVAAGAAAWFSVRRMVDVAAQLGTAGATAGPALVARVVADTVFAVGSWWVGIACAMALADGVWQRAAWLRRNRMSLQEVRDEAKQQEGDPHHRQRRERAHRELLAGSIRDGVSRADVVVVNPTHLAIGLRYRAEEVDAPVVTVTGRGEIARQIKREARRQWVPEYDDKAVARAMIDLEVGDEVPDTLFEPVAIVFRWLEEHEARRRR